MAVARIADREELGEVISGRGDRRLGAVGGDGSVHAARIEHHAWQVIVPR